MTCLFKFYTTKSQQHSFQETVIAGFQPNNIENKTAIFQYFNISRKQDINKTRFHVFKISFLIEPFQQIHDVTFPVDDFSRKLHISQQSRVPVILQRPFADAKPSAHFLARQVVFTVQYRAIVHYHVLHVFQHPVEGGKQYQRNFGIFRYQIHTPTF